MTPSRASPENLAVFVAALPSPYREAMTLTELQGMSQKDAAEMLGISLSGMKSRVQRGRQQIREMLQACCGIALDARGRVLSYERRPDGKVPENCCDDGRRSASADVLTPGTRSTSARRTRPTSPRFAACCASAKLPFDDVPPASRSSWWRCRRPGRRLRRARDVRRGRAVALAGRRRAAPRLGPRRRRSSSGSSWPRGRRAPQRLFLLTTTAAPFFARRGFDGSSAQRRPMR